MKDDTGAVGGVVVKIIDFGLARLEDDEGRTYHTAFDSETFEGSGKLPSAQRHMNVLPYQMLRRLSVRHLPVDAGSQQW